MNNKLQYLIAGRTKVIEKEEIIVNAEERLKSLEYELFEQLRDKVAEYIAPVQELARRLAELDCLRSLAEAAIAGSYARPEINEEGLIEIIEGRHPVLEAIQTDPPFVPNDTRLDGESCQIALITGPNMAGKSTVLRQTALIVLMAQMGSFVPAAAARIGVVDRIFTRVGAMDDLRRGQSTFMVEMNETANILHNATARSLVVLDEIGRGTSTFDGLSIAWAVSEDLLTRDGKGVKTIFATHYHELTELAAIHPRIKNFNIAVREWNDSIIFLHKLMPGGASRSYGIQVAALAGVPRRVVDRAQEILRNIEKGEFTSQGLPRLAPEQGEQPPPLPLFSAEDDILRKKLAAIELDRLTPLEALTMLYELKEAAESSCP